MKLLIKFKVSNIKQRNLMVKSAEKIQKVYIQEFQKLIMVKQWYYQNMQYVVVKDLVGY